MPTDAAPPPPSGTAAAVPAPPAAAPQRIGLVLVHGIGEQRRFQHLDSQLRDLLRALDKIGYRATVDISGANSAAFHAEQDTWNAGPGASVVASLTPSWSSVITHELHIHEVWWADVNEPYSLAKQVRFWFWGLAAWAYRGKRRSTQKGADEVSPPVVGGASHLLSMLRVRGELFLVGIVFALGGLSVGLVAAVASRLFNLQPPRLLRVVTNYVSGVKLYNEQYRHGPGFSLGRSPHELLDNVGNPPRVSVRRRMMRAIADVACAQPAPDTTDGAVPRDARLYDRWYVFAHSLGSIVAFNGLMETGHAWPGYLDRQRWERLKKLDMVRPGTGRMKAGTATIPPRPVWSRHGERVDRTMIFDRFHGLLTYGSPLEKFATLWPARVPLSREPAFPHKARWFNVLDPTDPVSGVLTAFSPPEDRGSDNPLSRCPPVANIGYRSYWVLLQSHLHYLTAKKGTDLATQAMRWVLFDDPSMMTGRPGEGSASPVPDAFDVGSAPYWRRRAGAWLWWLAVSYTLAALAGTTLPGTIAGTKARTGNFWREAEAFPLGHEFLASVKAVLPSTPLRAAYRILARSWPSDAYGAANAIVDRAGSRIGLPSRSGSCVLLSVLAPLLAGVVFRLLTKPDPDDAPAPASGRPALGSDRPSLW